MTTTDQLKAVAETQRALQRAIESLTRLAKSTTELAIACARLSPPSDG